MNQQERYYTLETQNIDLDDLTVQGKILDIGGGGEGIIGQVLGDKVVAIDKSKEELEEAPEGPLKVVMDAKELKFMSDSFNSVTSFFTMMYIEKKHQRKVFEEIYRVLISEGKFKLWDTKIEKFKGGKKIYF